MDPISTVLVLHLIYVLIAQPHTCVFEYCVNMSGLLGEAFTPCPSRSRSSGSGSEAFDSFLETDSAFEATAQIEFTTEFREPVLRGSRPRRANCPGSNFQIHDDAVEQSVGEAKLGKRRRPNTLAKPASQRKSSLLAHPAQRFRPKATLASSSSSHPDKHENDASPMMQQAETKPAGVAIAQSNHGQTREDSHEHALKRNVRRNTVYIPSDDTTVASVFMGLFSPLKKQQAAQPEAIRDTQVNTLEDRIAKRQARKSLMTSARKAPLRPSTKIAQEAVTRVDIAGKNGGKENIPPGTLIGIEGKHSFQSAPLSKFSRTNTTPASRPAGHNDNNRSSTAKVSQSSTRLQSQNPRPRSALEEKQGNAQASCSSSSREVSGSARAKIAIKSSASLDRRTSALLNCSDHSKSICTRGPGSLASGSRNINHQYPRLVENTTKPSLYDDNWLLHQETVITQLANSLLESTIGGSTPCSLSTLRLEMLELYHTDFFVQLHKRLQASLACGTLSIPKELVSRYSRLRQDIGLRRKFLDIWVQSYDIRVLVSAAEAIIGRRVSNDSDFVEFEITKPDGKMSKDLRNTIRKLERFLESFLLRNEDMGPDFFESRGDTTEVQAKFYRRTVLRSILFVALLDQTTQNSNTNSQQPLFRRDSSFKSSTEVLQALARVLLPSCGDISKTLSHLGCHLIYEQHRLREYDYQIKNLAVDLRDGVRLTRIVEALFFSPQQRSDNEDRTGATFQAGEALSTIGDETDFPLSKLLKYPCESRAAKVYNAQIALSALSSIASSISFLGEIRAEDIVDGYREKTVALLWALVRKWGFTELVDWEDTSREIARLKRKCVKLLGYERCQDKDWFVGNDLDNDDEYIRMLRQWASLLAALKGQVVTNMTTSFADGKIYESIVDEYEHYITGSAIQNNATNVGKSRCLESRLQLLGCSSHFGK